MQSVRKGKWSEQENGEKMGEIGITVHQKDDDASPNVKRAFSKEGLVPGWNSLQVYHCCSVESKHIVDKTFGEMMQVSREPPQRNR